MASYLVAALSVTSVVSASWDGNLNYNSPSRRHPSLGIDVPKVVKRGIQPRSWDPPQLNFTHGVASGDPYPNSVVLWTRISPTIVNDRSNVTVSGSVALYNHDTETYIKAATNPVCVEYQVGSDKNFTKVLDKGTAYTTSDIDYTVKVEAKNLKPFTQYYYQFTVCGSTKKSPLGRTKTSPGVDDDVTKIGLAVYSCSNYPNGYFNAYGNAARKDKVDYIHLGDYIYETGKGTLGKDPRATNPKGEIFTLYDYRTRIAQYRTDLDLRLSHQQFPWIPVWDDHEVSNNGYRDGSSGLNNTEDSFRKDGGVSVDQRKMNAVRAYFEWMPIRQVDMDDNLRIWRTFQMGKLFDLIMLDTRNYDRSITTLNWNDEYVAEIKDDAGRTLMGGRQENWFYGQLSKSKQREAVWRIVGNQIIFSRINNTARSSEWLNADQWDGYTANRNRTLAHLYTNKIPNTIMLAGDSHANWVSDLVWLDEPNYPYDQATGAGSIGVEFAGTAVSSSGFGGTISSANTKSKGLVKDNRELQWSEGYYRGYYELQISPKAIVANYYGCPTVATRNPFEISLANFTVLVGENRIQRSVANGTVESGALQRGSLKMTNLTLNTETGGWNVTSFDQMFIKY
ncbi:PhoD-like phosphatase-domain-containing protein [Clohesyomyces aquaticus]|uniref:PhoD-like phosphatase-domain-containing protein n=1 Tax=Clohesyomyces aquaticus TaxID=1231657 RepID=A0A1Y1Y6E8_9PLEO|nr:PhoD-like phosphatase-domain-containing protein [Clohesyomyces aquaticus]